MTKDRRKSKIRKKFKIAVFVSDLFDFYQNLIIEGINRQAGFEHCKILLINGGIARHNPKDVPRKVTQKS